VFVSLSTSSPISHNLRKVYREDLYESSNFSSLKYYFLFALISILAYRKRSTAFSRHNSQNDWGLIMLKTSCSRKTPLKTIIVLLLLTGACIALLTYQFVEWPSQDDSILILEPADIVVGPSGNIYVADIWQSYIQIFDVDGNFISKWRYPPDSTDPDTFRPTGMAIDGAETIYVTDYLSNRVQQFDSSGNLINSWGEGGTNQGEFNYPAAIAVGPQGNILVADTGNNRIQVFDSSGTFIFSWGIEGTAQGQLSGPFDIAVDPRGNVFVADTYNHRIQKFDMNGSFITSWGSKGEGEGKFAGPGGVWVDKLGYVFVADTQNNRMQKFDNDGNFITTWSSFGEEEGDLFGPSAVTVDASGNVYIADSKNYRVQKYSPVLGGTKDDDPDLEDLCIVWVGTWDVEYGDGSTVLWVIEESMGRDSNMFPCVASGVASREGEDDVPFKLYSFQGRKFMYTEEVGELDQQMPYTFINLTDDEFTAEPGGVYDIISGTRQQ
jgi:DNA-binding beta-propeller fold protein YncE